MVGGIFLIGDDADVAADVKSTVADAERSEESRFDRLAELRKLFCIFVIMIDDKVIVFQAVKLGLEVLHRRFQAAGGLSDRFVVNGAAEYFQYPVRVVDLDKAAYGLVIFQRMLRHHRAYFL
ncbi:hypothetical protein SDC9_183294 [bioreactor metagenome]|uniref:Uncharacterized protein n=1 Tax=bioreactor metagenome TaxID=1076179 RepID=A0A645HBQ2_9ZZZZ